MTVAQPGQEATPSDLEAGSPVRNDQTTKPESEWWKDSKHDPWEGLGGIPRTAKFLNADRDMTTVIFRRFRELSIRNLLSLEARVAALQAFQQKLDNTHRSELKNDNGVFNNADDDVLDADMSWEEFAVLASNLEERESRTGIPLEVLKRWGEMRWKRKKEIRTTDEARITDEARRMVRLKWDVALAIQEAVKDYRKRPNMLTLHMNGS